MHRSDRYICYMESKNPRPSKLLPGDPANNPSHITNTIYWDATVRIASNETVNKPSFSDTRKSDDLDC
jgi:hypothetical protein